VELEPPLQRPAVAHFMPELWPCTDLRSGQSSARACTTASVTLEQLARHTDLKLWNLVAIGKTAVSVASFGKTKTVSPAYKASWMFGRSSAVAPHS
jgi:hypothetical protein